MLGMETEAIWDSLRLAFLERGERSLSPGRGCLTLPEVASCGNVPSWPHPRPRHRGVCGEERASAGSGDLGIQRLPPSSHLRRALPMGPASSMSSSGKRASNTGLKALDSQALFG